MVIAQLSPTTPVPARYWKRFAECFANALPWAGERLVEALTFRSPHLCLRVFGSAWPCALPLLFLGCAHGARTAKRFAHGALAKHLQCHWRGAFGGPRQWIAFVLSEGIHSPKTPRHWVAFALPLACAHAVLQCAPRARTKGSGVLRTRQSASKNAPVTGQEQRKVCENR